MSQVVALVLLITGGGQLIVGAMLLRVTVTSLLGRVILAELGPVPAAVATFVILPALISEAVTTCSAVQVAWAPGARVYGAFGHVTLAIGSLMLTPVRVTFPVLVTVIM